METEEGTGAPSSGASCESTIVVEIFKSKGKAKEEGAGRDGIELLKRATSPESVEGDGAG